MGLDRIGKYRVVQQIGKGAMGEVYKAHDPLLNRHVAIKTISPGLAADANFKRRFQREAQSAAQLGHPNIVTVFDLGEEDGLTYMAMELLEGKELKDVIRSGGAGLAEKLAIMDQICEGLAFAHARGIVHRDLKPSNIHVQPNGHVKILDFGLALLGESEMTRTGTVLGTPNYMSPEQVRGQKADARSDVFSLGAVFYELLARHRAFDADSVHGVLFQILEQEPEPLRKWSPQTPSALIEVIERALSKDPARRPADAGELARALRAARQAMAGETVMDERAGASLSTVIRPGEATVLSEAEPAEDHGRVSGATALSPARRPVGSGRGSTARTVRPHATVAGGPPTELAAAAPSRALILGGSLAALVVLAIAGFLWLRPRATTRSVPSAEVSEVQVGILTEALVTSQVELARTDLANRAYEAAGRRAEEALKLAPGNAEAQDVLDQARQALGQIEAAVAEARGAFGRGDVVTASAALGRVMALDPRHPVVSELSGQLNEHFLRQAEDGRSEAGQARATAQRAGASSLAVFREGHRLSSEAETNFRRQEYAVAAQRFLESRNAFERAKREADEARAAARPAPSTRPTSTPAMARAATPLPSDSGSATPSPFVSSPAREAAPLPAPTQVAAPPSAQPTVSPLLASASLSSPAAAPQGDVDKLAAERVVLEYGRAIESQDVGLFRRLYPGLSSEDEKRLREAFKAIKSQVVDIRVESVEVDGNRATVRVTRQDIIKGRPMNAVAQTFRLIRGGGGWLIQSIGQ